MDDDDPILARVLPAEAKHLARVQAVWGLLKEVGQREMGLLVPASARLAR